IVTIVISVFAPVFAPKSYSDAALGDNNAAPEWITRVFPTMISKDQGGFVTINNAYPLGADKLGRDLLSRLIYGSRISLAVALIGPLISIVVGLIVGLVAGYVGGKVDNVLMRLVDVMYAFPTLLLIILLMAVFRTSFAGQQPGTLAYSL